MDFAGGILAPRGWLGRLANVAASNSIPPEHARLRRMLLGMLEVPPPSPEHNRLRQMLLRRFL